MALSSQRGKTRCLIRQKLVENTPEEEVRQAFLQLLMGHSAFPKSLISVEVSLDQMPHLALTPPKLDRRADILCYTKEGEPLLLVECKAVSITEETKRQAMGYNYYVKAPYIALVNQKTIQLMGINGDAPEGKPFPQYRAFIPLLATLHRL